MVLDLEWKVAAAVKELKARGLLSQPQTMLFNIWRPVCRSTPYLHINVDQTFFHRVNSKPSRRAAYDVTQHCPPAVLVNPAPKNSPSGGSQIAAAISCNDRGRWSSWSHANCLRSGGWN